MKRSELEAIIEEEIHTYLEYFSQLNERKNAIPSKEEPTAQAQPTATKGAPDKKEKKDKPEFKYDRKKGNQKRERRKKEEPPTRKNVRGTTKKGGEYYSAGTVPSIRGRTMDKNDPKKRADQVKKRAELGQFLINKLERGSRTNNEFYQRVVNHAKKKLELKDDEKPTKKELFSFVWAIATDMVLKGVTTDKEGRTQKRKDKTVARKEREKAAKKKERERAREAKKKEFAAKKPPSQKKTPSKAAATKKEGPAKRASKGKSSTSDTSAAPKTL